MISQPTVGWLLEFVAALALIFGGFEGWRGKVAAGVWWPLGFGLWLLGHLIGGPGL